MVRLSAEIKRGFLSSLAFQAQRNAVPLLLTLQECQLRGFESCKSGRLVMSHSGAGKSTVFIVPKIGEMFRQEEIFGLTQELLEVYNDALTTLGLTVTQDTSQDAQILPMMQADDRLAEITVTQPDFTYLLSPWT